ncbi:MAG: DNA polymerase III subunit beta [Phycisphaerales bacterium]|nr:MAG: DNA polymerase III subunit beta [Phycisphaerales bacterium]
MKVNFSRSALAEALALLTSVVPSRTPKPVLRCVLIAAGKKEVQISGTDLEVGLTCTVSGVQVEQPGEVVVEADKLAAIVRESAEDVLLLEASEGACELVGADSHFTIYGQDAKQFPQVPTFQGEPDITVGLEELQAGIEQCLFATAKESSRYAINGVLWEIKGKKLLLVATDGRRLARCRVGLAATPDEATAQHKIIIPAKTMALLEKIGSHDKEKVALKLLDNKILVSCANVVISSNLVEGNFPKYEDIVPADYDKKLKLSCSAVLSAVRRAALLTSEESKGIRLSLSEGSLVFSGRAPETGAAEVKMAVDYAGEPIDIGFNPQFLIEALRVMRTPEFEIEVGQPDRPGLMRSGADLLYVLMPINLG